MSTAVRGVPNPWEWRSTAARGSHYRWPTVPSSVLNVLQLGRRQIGDWYLLYWAADAESPWLPTLGPAGVSGSIFTADAADRVRSKKPPDCFLISRSISFSLAFAVASFSVVCSGHSTNVTNTHASQNADAISCTDTRLEHVKSTTLVII
eukprot:388079-Rhodomonas_salina.5